MAIDTSERKWRTGKRLNNGFGPSWITWHPSPIGCASGIHGANPSITSTTSASASHGPGFWPTSIGWSDEIEIALVHHWHTGIAQRSAISANAANPACVPARAGR